MADKNSLSSLPSTSEKLEIISGRIIIQENLENLEFRNCLIVESELLRCKFYDCVFQESKIMRSKVVTSIGTGPLFPQCVLVRSPEASQPTVQDLQLQGRIMLLEPRVMVEFTRRTLNRIEFIKKTWEKLPSLFPSPKHIDDPVFVRLLTIPNHINHHDHFDE